MGSLSVYDALTPGRAEDGTPILPFTANDAANRLLGRDPNAFLIGLVLDQQIKLEKAWEGPWLLSQRLGHLEVARIAAMPEEELAAVFRQKPALHRFPASMAKRVQQLCALLHERYGGDGAALWRGIPTADDVYWRLRTLPGFGEQKARLAMKVLTRFLSLRADGWEPYAAWACGSPEAPGGDASEAA